MARTGGQSDGVLACLDKKQAKPSGNTLLLMPGPLLPASTMQMAAERFSTVTAPDTFISWTEKQETFLTVTRSVEGVIEASPAIYQSYMVVGTRDCKIWGMELQ